MMRFLTGAFAALWLLACGASAALSQSAGIAWSQVVVTSTSSGAYTGGQCLGGLLTIPAMSQPGGRGGTIIRGFSFVDTASQTAANDAMQIYIFNALPTGTYTDHSTCTIAAADAPFVMNILTIATANCQIQSSAPTICTLAPAVPIGVAFPPTSPNLYAVAIVTNTPTYGLTNRLYFNFTATPAPF